MNKKTSGHPVQMYGKFLNFAGKDGKKVKRNQNTAIDDATSIRTLKSI